MSAYDESLTRLGLDSVDMYLIHQPYGDVFGAWSAMSELYTSGRVGGIGLSNFTSDRIADITGFGGLMPAINQIEMHPFATRTSERKYMANKNIIAQAWAPLAQGNFGIFTNEILSQIAAKHGKSISAVVLRYLNQLGVALVVKSTKAERMKENLNIFDFKLDDTDMQVIAKLDEDKIMMNHKDPAFAEFLINY